jgi:hypothetical protein
MTLRDALGGPWATHWILWLSLYPPTVLLILVRESATEYPEPWWPLLSATLQHLVTGAIIVGGGALARRRSPRLPLAVVAALWGSSAVVRAAMGSAVAEVVAGVPGDFLFRLTSWLLVIVAWLPALVYGIAQVDRRRSLIGELEHAQQELEGALARATESSETMRARLAQTVNRSVSPVLDDLRERLAVVRGALDPDLFTQISTRLARLHEETADLLSAPPPNSRATISPMRRASLREVFDVHLSQPWLAAGLVTVEVLTLILLDAWRIFGWSTATEILVASLASGFALGAILRFAPRSRLFSSFRGSSVLLSAAGTAILIQAWVMLHSGIDSVTWQGAVLVPVLGGGLVVACSVVVAVVVLARANESDERLLRAIRADTARLNTEHDAALAHAQHRLSELMHGPVQGRIAACVMALTFFSAPDAPPGALASVMDDVLQHLQAASRDLSTLTENRPLASRAPDRDPALD